jgi:hypothetical protein
MKKLITLFCFFASIQTSPAQKLNVDSILQKVVTERDKDKNLIY